MSANADFKDLQNVYTEGNEGNEEGSRGDFGKMMYSRMILSKKDENAETLKGWTRTKYDEIRFL